MVGWQAELAKHWPSVRFGSATVEKQNGQYLFEVQIFLDDLNPEAVRAELYAEAQNTAAAATLPMTRGEHLVGSANGYTYTARVSAARPASDFTPRLVPQHAGALVPLESAFILWHDSPSWR